MQIYVPGTRKGLKKVYAAMETQVQRLFADLPGLLDSSFRLDIALAYMFFRLEQAQRTTLYCGARKLHMTESGLTWKAIDSHDLTRAGFRQLFKTIFGFDISEAAQDCLSQAETIRDDLMHGRAISEKKKREAIARVLHYAEQMNRQISDEKRLGFKPFSGDLRGFVGRKGALDTSTTRWILKGMGFALS